MPGEYMISSGLPGFAIICGRDVRMPGYSIMVYRLDQAELDAALHGDLQTLAGAIEHAATPSRP